MSRTQSSSPQVEHVYAEMHLEADSSEGLKVQGRGPSLRIQPALVDALKQKKLRVDSPAVLGSEAQPGIVAERLFGLLPKSLLNPKTRVIIRLANQQGIPVSF